MPLPSNIMSSAFKRRIITSAAIAIVLASLIGATILLLVPASTAPTYDLAETTQISESLHHSSSTVGLTESFNGTLFQERPFRGNESWDSEVVDLVYPYGYYTEYSLTPEDDGLRIVSTNDVISFTRLQNVVVENLTSLTFSVSVTSTSGFAQVRVGVIMMDRGVPIVVQLNESASIDLWYQETVNLTGQSSETLQIEVPIDDINLATDEWILESQFRIRVTTIEPSDLTIRWANASASYANEVVPVRMSPKSTDGEDLLSNPYLDKLSAKVALNISSATINRSSVVFVTGADRVLYLPVGTYTGFGGWYTPGRTNWTTPLSFATEQDRMTLLDFTVPTIRLDIVLSPCVPWVSLDVYFRDAKSMIHTIESTGLDYSYLYYYRLNDLYSSPSTSVYLPAFDGDLIFKCESMESVFTGDLDSLTYEQPISGISNLELTIRLSFLQVDGWSLSVGGMIVETIFGAVFLIAMITLWRNSELSLWHRIRDDPRVISVILLFASTMCPWFQITTRVADSFSTATMNYVGFMGLAIVLIWSGGSTILSINMPLWPYLAIGVAGLWLPVLGLMHSLRTDTPWSTSPVVIYSVLAPVMTIGLMTPAFIYVGPFMTLHIGAYLAVLSLVTWSLRHLHKRYRTGKSE